MNAGGLFFSSVSCSLPFILALRFPMIVVVREISFKSSSSHSVLFTLLPDLDSYLRVVAGIFASRPWV